MNFFSKFFTKPLPPPPNPYLSGGVWAYVLKYTNGNVAAATELVHQAALAMSQELGCSPDPYSAFAVTHDGGQTLMTRLSKGLTPFQIYYGTNKDGSLMTKEQAEARAASKKAATLAEQNGDVGAVDRWFRENM